MNQIHNQINQTLNQFQALLNKALQQDSRTLFRLSVGKLQEVESLLEYVTEPTSDEALIESPSEPFKEDSDNISDVELLPNTQEEVQIENKGETNEKDS